MYNKIISRYIELVKEIGCALAIFTSGGRILHLNEEAIGVLGGNIIHLEILPGRYVENEDFWENLHRNKTLFTHKALLKAGTETYKIRGMMHEIASVDDDGKEQFLYILAFEIRDDRIFGSVTLERIIENSGFVAFHWVADVKELGEFHARYVSNSVNKFGYKREEFYDGKIPWNKFVYEEDRRLVKEEVFEHLRSGKLEYTRQYRIVTAQGQVVPVHDYVHLVTDGADHLLGVEIVIFDLLMETERNANLLLLENAVNRSHNIVLVWQYVKEEEQPRQLRYVSNNIERLGISSSLLRSGDLDYYDYMYEEDKEKVQEVYRQFHRKGYQYLSQEYRLVNDTGQEFWIRDESNLVELPGGMRYIESILTDISETKRRELHLIEQQEALQRKLQYIESADTMLSDMSVLDFIDKEELQELQGALATVTNTYNVIIDLDGDPITYPEGPDMNMGAFYDMFERMEYKQGYFELNKQLRKEGGPVKMTLQEFTKQEFEIKNDRVVALPENGNLMELVKAASKMENNVSEGVLVGLPLYVNDKHMATWINCAFTEEEVERIDRYLPSLWNICKYMATFVYSGTITQQQAQKARMSELQARELLERSFVVRDILRRCNESNDENALSYVLHKVGDYLKVSRISLFRQETGQAMPECWYEWDSKEMEEDIDWKMMENYQQSKQQRDDISQQIFRRQGDAFSKDGQMVFNGDKIPLRVRRIFWENHIRALVVMPFKTLANEQNCITFVESDYERVWKEEELSFMRTVVSILQGFLQRMKTNVNVHEVTQSQSAFFDLSREYIYIKNTITEEIVYVNPRLAEKLGENVVGRRCYEVFRKQSIRCMDCYQQKKECKELCNCRMYSHIFEFPVRLREMPVNWGEQGTMKLVMISREDG